MDILALAVPFFLLALLIELAIDRLRGTGHYRINDAVNSLSVGMFMSTSGYFTKLIPALILAYVLQDLAIFDVHASSSDVSACLAAIDAIANTTLFVLSISFNL